MTPNNSFKPMPLRGAAKFQCWAKIKQGHELTDQWRNYRRRGRQFLWLLGFGFPLMCSVLAATDGGTTASIVAYGLLILWVLCIAIVNIRLQFFPCPNCGKPFAYRTINNLPFFVNKCVHCGLAKWEH